jgi:hypothetical protein
VGSSNALPLHWVECEITISQVVIIGSCVGKAYLTCERSHIAPGLLINLAAARTDPAEIEGGIAVSSVGTEAAPSLLTIVDECT